MPAMTCSVNASHILIMVACKDLEAAQITFHVAVAVEFDQCRKLSDTGNATEARLGRFRWRVPVNYSLNLTFIRWDTF